MARAFESDELVLASHNRGKLKELGEIFGARVPKLSTAADYGVEAPPETGTTFVENAMIKARAVAAATGRVALADDSGICVSGLGGAPGVYSADWAEDDAGNRDFGRAMARVERELGDNPDRAAYFACVLVLAWPDGHAEVFEGRVNGRLVFPPRGDRGFGYDPIFVADGDSQTFAEIDPAVKNAKSHRADALAKMMTACFS